MRHVSTPTREPSPDLSPAPPPPDPHYHCLPSHRTVAAVLDHTDSRLPTDRFIDLRPIVLTLAAVEDDCAPCQLRMGAWLAHHGDPWDIVQLSGPVAADARRVARTLPRGWPAPTCRQGRVREVLRWAFGAHAADVVGIVATGHDLTPAVRLIRGLRLLNRYRVVRSIVHGLTHRAPATLTTMFDTDIAMVANDDQKLGVATR